MSIEETYNSFDLEAIAVSVCLLSGYHAFLYTLVFCFASNRIQLSTNLKNSILWIKKHQQKTDAPTVTLAVQTLRNTILVAVFIGGYALELGISTTNAYLTNEGQFAKLRSLIITVLAVGSFLAWATVIRIAAHLGYMIGTLDYSPPKNELISSVVSGDIEEGSKQNLDDSSSWYLSSYSFKRVPLDEALVVQPPDIPKESARMLQMLLICFK